MTEDAVGRYQELNRAMWDERVPLHAGGDFYDVASIRAGRSTLRGFEVDEVGDVTGRRLLHLQCHIGTDTVSWARSGATVTGLDFSGPAIESARSLAADLGLESARFVQSDVYDASTTLDGATFDIVYTGLGALCWLPDLTRWAEVVASLLAPGGFLYLAEFHPVGLAQTQGEDYFDVGPHVYDEPGTYADFSAPTEQNVSVEWNHPLGSVVSAVAGAGLTLQFLHEYDFTFFEYAPNMVRERDTSRSDGPTTGGVYRLPPDVPRVPLLYSLRAAR